MIEISRFIQEFLNSNVGVVTFLVGFVAIYLYLKQKKDKKRAAASLILQEIRYAEQLMRNYTANKQYKLSDQLLPTNSWNDNIHLFLKDLEESEIDLISRFYSEAAYIDCLITKISNYKNKPLKPIILSRNPFPESSTAAPTGVPMSQTVAPIDPMKPTQDILRDISRDIEFVYNTPVSEKLKNIARKKWYHII